VEVGEAFGLLMTPEGRDDPYPTYRVLHEYPPLVELTGLFAVATGYAVIDEILRDPRMRVSDAELVSRLAPNWRPGPAAASMFLSMLQTNPPEHARMRRLAAGAFTARRVAGLRDTITRQATDLAEYLAALGGPVDFMAEYAYPLPVRVICALLGLPIADHQWIRERAEAVTVVLEPMLDLSTLEPADVAARELEVYFTDQIERRRREPGDDLTSALVAVHDAPGSTLTREELLANLVLLLIAGFETTTNLLGNGLVVLLNHPDAAARLREDPALADRYVEELLRFDSPVQLTSRWSREPVEFAGTRLEPYSEVMLVLGAGNRDGRHFAEPDRFDPGRDPNQPLSFGAGAHYCLGAALARLEAQVAFPILLRRFPDLAPAGDPVRRDRLTLRGYASLPVSVTGTS
jgi:cytochrome P450